MAKKRTTKRAAKTSRKKAGRKKAGRKKAGRARSGGALGKATVAALHAELARRLGDLQRQRDALMKQLEALDAEIIACNGSSAGAGSGGRGRKRAGAAGGRRVQNATNLVTALEKLLTKRTMGVSEMADAVQKAGYRTSSPNFRTIVNQTLIQNDKVFKRVSRGQYTAR